MRVNGRNMAYVDAGSRDARPVLLPTATSSTGWSKRATAWLFPIGSGRATPTIRASMPRVRWRIISLTWSR